MFLLFAFSLECLQSSICPLSPSLSHWGHAICLHRANHLSLFLPLQSPFPKPVLTLSFLRCACRFHAHMVSLLPFTGAIVYLIFSPLSFSARYLIPCCHKLSDFLGPKRLSFFLAGLPSFLLSLFSFSDSCQYCHPLLPKFAALL